MIAGNHEGIHTWQLTGSGNVVRQNRLWANRNGNFVDPGPLLLIDNWIR